MTSRHQPGSRLPAVDERLVVPEQGFEIVAGEVVEVSPAEEKHGRGQSKLSSLLEAHVIDGWLVAADMLTRTDRHEDFAPDVSVYPEVRDPETGGRQLEALAFEVLDSQSLGDAGRKARSLVARGVRRVFAVDVRRKRVFEWSEATSEWSLIPSDGQIADELLRPPLEVTDLVSAARAEDAIARALLARRHPVFEAAMAARHADGVAVGRLEALRLALTRVLEGRGLLPTASEREQLERASEADLVRWLGAAAQCGSVAALIAS